MMQEALPQRDAKPGDLPGCHVMIDQLFDTIEAIVKDRDSITEDRDRIRDAYNELRRYLYGQRRERFEDPDQLKLFDAAPEELLTRERQTVRTIRTI